MDGIQILSFAKLVGFWIWSRISEEKKDVFSLFIVQYKYTEKSQKEKKILKNLFCSENISFSYEKKAKSLFQQSFAERISYWFLDIIAAFLIIFIALTICNFCCCSLCCYYFCYCLILFPLVHSFSSRHFFYIIFSSFYYFLTFSISFITFYSGI